jgi:hypothetical protein
MRTTIDRVIAERADCAARAELCPALSQSVALAGKERAYASVRRR